MTARTYRGRMFKRNRTITYANVTATLALVLAMSGGALAASHYLINSTSQLNPKVIKALKGAAGVAGSQGPTGPPGKEGLAGKEGKGGAEGQAGKQGPEGKEGKEGKAGTEGKEGKEGKVATKAVKICEKEGKPITVPPCKAEYSEIEVAEL